jgi:predicted ATPase/DNA-binding SARP family transcriptional activator
VVSLSSERLPVRLSPLVGRQSELRDVLDTLAHSRLLTLTGPGGTGKTRLGIAAASAASATFPDGVYWIELAPVDDPDIVARVVAGRLGVPDHPGQDPARAVAEQVGDGRKLLVLDNCEHLAGAVVRLAERLLASCPSLSILATSREVLGIDGERSWPVPPLSLPEPGARPTAAAFASCDAVKLFEQRARLVQPAFRVTDDNAAAVRSVCARLDGLPLAIELAAARMRILSVGQLADRLGDIFGVLVGGTRSAPPRHQALRATLDWSYNLLDESERAVLRRLAVFAGGFTLTMAEQVATTGVGSDQGIDVLARLADKSLLQVDVGGDATRFHLLETVREYSQERLAEAAEDEAVRRAHMLCLAATAEDLGPRIARGADGLDTLERDLDALDAEMPNLRAALDFARHSGDAVAALRIAGPLGHFGYLRGHYQEIRQWMDMAVNADADAPAALRAKALLGSGRLALLLCDYVPAVRRLETALRLYRELDDAAGIAATLQVLGSVAREQGRYARSVELHAESLATAENAGDRLAIASAHGYLGFVLWLQCDYERASSECQLSLAISRDLADTEGIAWALISLGAIARYRGVRDRAAVLLAESKSLAERIGFREGIAWSLEQLGLLALDRADPEARDMLTRSLEIHQQLQDSWRTCSVLEDLAALAVADGQPGRAASLLGTAEAVRVAIGTVVAPCERPQHEQTTAQARSELGDVEFEAAFERGKLAQVEQIRDQLAALASSPGQATPTGASATGSIPALRAGRDRARAARIRATGDLRAVAGDGVAGDDSAGMLRIRALGGASVHRGDVPVTAADWGYAKPRELLFLLATSPSMTRDQLGAALWPELPRERLGNALHTALREVRRALGDPGWVVYADGRYGFNSDRAHECDVRTFENSLAAARRARPQAAALPELQRAVAAYGGEFLAGMACGEWANTRRDELARSFESALLAMGRLHVAAGRFQPAAAAFRRAVAHEPLNETAHRELMSCWARMGETARAVRHYEELAELLRSQVGVPPAAETAALFKRLTSTT